MPLIIKICTPFLTTKASFSLAFKTFSGEENSTVRSDYCIFRSRNCIDRSRYCTVRSLYCTVRSGYYTVRLIISSLEIAVALLEVTTAPLEATVAISEVISFYDEGQGTVQCFIYFRCWCLRSLYEETEKKNDPAKGRKEIHYYGRRDLILQGNANNGINPDKQCMVIQATVLTQTINAW